MLHTDWRNEFIVLSLAVERPPGSAPVRTNADPAFSAMRVLAVKLDDCNRRCLPDHFLTRFGGTFGLGSFLWT